MYAAFCARSVVIAGGILLAAHLAATAQETQDELKLRDGSTLRGRVVEVDKNTVVLRTAEGLRELKRSEVTAILFDRPATAPAQGVTQTQQAPSKIPPGFTCGDGLKIVRVISYRQITSNRVTEEKKFEPEIARLSADGSKIAFWCPTTGLYTINPDGTERNLILDRAKIDVTGQDRFEFSPSGKTIFWQERSTGAIRRINSDGTGEQLVAREGSEYVPLRFRQGGKRVFYGSRAGIYSIDTEGRGEFQEHIVGKRLAQIYDMPQGDMHMLGEFDASEDGTRLALVVWHPKSKQGQLCAMNANGTGFRLVTSTEFVPQKASITPDGKQILFWQYGVAAYTVDWDGANLTKLPIPFWDGNYSGLQNLNRFSADGKLFGYEGGEGGGSYQVTALDGGGRFDPTQPIRWDYFDTSLFAGAFLPSFTPDFRKFCFISRYSTRDRPRQIVVGEVNPTSVEGLPVVSEISFPAVQSVNPQVPNHRGPLKIRIKPAASEIQRVQYQLSPSSQMVSTDPVQWVADRGYWGLNGDHILRDDGKNGDAAAGDGVYTFDQFGPSASYKPAAGKHVLRITVHDEKNAVNVDIDGVEIKY